jgi:hypothetical protein
VVALAGGTILAFKPSITKWLFDHTSVRWAAAGVDPQELMREKSRRAPVL